MQHNDGAPLLAYSLSRFRQLITAQSNAECHKTIHRISQKYD